MFQAHFSDAVGILKQCFALSVVMKNNPELKAREDVFIQLQVVLSSVCGVCYCFLRKYFYFQINSVLLTEYYIITNIKNCDMRILFENF